MQLNYIGTGYKCTSGTKCRFTSIFITQVTLRVEAQAQVKVTGFTETGIKPSQSLRLILHVLKLTLPSFYKFTIGLKRQVSVYLETYKTL